MRRRSSMLVPITFGGLALSPSVSSNAAYSVCTLTTLSGRYVFTVRGFIEALEPGVQPTRMGEGARRAELDDGHLG